MASSCIEKLNTPRSVEAEGTSQVITGALALEQNEAQELAPPMLVDEYMCGTSIFHHGQKAGSPASTESLTVHPKYTLSEYSVIHQ